MPLTSVRACERRTRWSRAGHCSLRSGFSGLSLIMPFLGLNSACHHHTCYPAWALPVALTVREFLDHAPEHLIRDRLG